MFSLLYPAALWALAALALPLAVHLRRPPPRTVRLGSLRALENIPRRPWRQPRWRELLLLWTRLGLLAILALLLAGLRWTTPPPTGPRRWALLDPTGALTGEARARWQTLRADSYEPRRLVPGFPAVADESSSTPDGPAPDLWSLLREADAELPSGSTLAVFTPGRLAALRGMRPTLAHCRVEWVQLEDASAGVAHTWTVDKPFAKPLEGRSDARATTFTAHPTDNPATPHAVSVLILHDAAHLADARFVEVAVRAAGDSLGRSTNVQVHPITPDAENAATTDWTFWLSADTPPDGLAKREPRVVRYLGGDPVVADGYIVAPGDPAADGTRLQKRIAGAVSPSSTVLWTDGWSDPLLTYSRPAATNERWELRTRFDPDWNDLPRTAALPAWVRTLLFPATAAALLPADAVNDRRLADPAQGLPAETSAVGATVLLAADQPAFDLHWPLWALAAFLFAAERTLSLRRSPHPAASTRVPRAEEVLAR